MGARRGIGIVAAVWLAACGIGTTGTMVVTSGADASADDAASPTDGGTTPTVDAADDAPATFCTTVSPAPTFCADFDDPSATNPANGWDGSVADAGTTLVLDTAVFRSAPRALHATSSQGSPSALEKAFTVTSSLSVAFDVRYTALPATGAGDVSPIRLTPPVYPGQDIYFYAYANGSYFQEFGDDYSSGLPAPTLNAWHHVVLTITTNGTTSTITASLDGVDGWHDHTLAHTWPSPTTITMRIGVGALWVTPNGDVYVDNVVVRAQ